MTDHRERFIVTHDYNGFMLRKLDDLDWYAYFKKQQPDRNTVLLAAELDGHKFTATLHRMPLPRFLLTTRGFHWINETPFNR